MRSSSFTDTAHDRRHALRQKVNTPAFASFDGVTGGMILDLSEEGMSMQALVPVDESGIVPLNIALGEPAVYLETTGYVAWADALGRAGVRFSDLPEESRTRLRDWLSQNASTRSWKAPKWVVRDQASVRTPRSNEANMALSVESTPENTGHGMPSTSVQYEFKSLTGDLNAALNLIVSRACTITRGTGAALALAQEQGMSCRAVAGSTAPEVGAYVDAGFGFTGECARHSKALLCDDTESDPRLAP